MKPHITWILIADGERARISKNIGPGKGIEPALAHEYHAELLPSRDLTSDRQGRSFESAGNMRHAYEPKVDLHRAEKQILVKDLADLLNKKATEGAFERLVLIAPPQTLGDLRKALDANAKSKIIAEVPKDLTAVDDRDLPSHLRDFVF